MLGGAGALAIWCAARLALRDASSDGKPTSSPAPLRPALAEL